MRTPLIPLLVLPGHDLGAHRTEVGELCLDTLRIAPEKLETVLAEDVRVSSLGRRRRLGLERVGGRGWRRFRGGFRGRKGVGRGSGDRVREGMSRQTNCTVPLYLDWRT